MKERQLDKILARSRAIIRHAREVTRDVALTCRYYGISWQAVTLVVAGITSRTSLARLLR